MRKRKIKRILLPTIYVLLIVTSFFSISAVKEGLLKKSEDYSYSKSLMKDVTEMAIKEAGANKIVKPYTSGSVEKIVSFYNKDDDKSVQEKSLIYYEKTYMPSSGVIYASNEDFEVLCISDGKVTDIKEDNILGTVIEITQKDGYVVYYYSLKETIVNVGNDVKAGSIIGRATTNRIINDKNNVLIEIYDQGKAVDPEKYYITNNELQ